MRGFRRHEKALPMCSDKIAIRVDNVSKRYELYDRPSDQLKQYLMPRLKRLAGGEAKPYFREFWALRDIDLEVERGEAFGIVGRNGSGKSTLLQIITGTLSPTSGSVATHGRIGALLELGSGFDPEFTGRENVYLNAALLGFSRAETDEKFDAIASFADIGAHLDQPVRSYSSGMLVRLAIAVQMQVEPDILIIDEALAVGDALFQKRCFRQLDRLKDNGCTLLFVSHDQEIVRSLTSRAIFLNAGRAQSSGPTTEVLFAYREFLQQEEEAAFDALQKRLAENAPRKASKTEYGNFDVQILSVKVADGDGRPTSALYTGDAMSITIECQCNTDIENLNVAFRIRTKEGVKITTWGTLNEDMALFRVSESETFWSRKFSKGQTFSVTFRGDCRLGANLYEVEAIVALEYDRYYANQRILHWTDDAAHFTVLLRNKEYVFDGVVDMGLRSTRLE
ncbi:ABC transporter ATP-binding protein [Rhizobium sp. S163]|uniref:ABC transporter ATP-binding protein n=1 Tax=Rhizobium sp. S163 TaxID=3055039 RepID=UPI0025A9AE52|nr:ABC transporter ATP-binding protein [Rhizobium sp. S163]MDM9646678.1 ABC transporter ATP-binding protein [Rhizobium sp. S163]